MSSSRSTLYISFLFAFLLAGQLWAGNSSVPPQPPPVRSAPASAAKIESSSPQTSPVVAQMRDELQVPNTKPNQFPSVQPTQQGVTSRAVDAGSAARPSYISTRNSVRARLESQDPIVMDGKAFEARGVPKGIRSGGAPLPQAPKLSFDGENVVVEFGDRGGTEVIQVQMPAGKVSPSTLQERLTNVIDQLPKALGQPDRIERIICTEANCTVVIRGKALEFLPPEHTDRGKGETSTQVSMK